MSRQIDKQKIIDKINTTNDINVRNSKGQIFAIFNKIKISSDNQILNATNTTNASTTSGVDTDGHSVSSNCDSNGSVSTGCDSLESSKYFKSFNNSNPRIRKTNNCLLKDVVSDGCAEKIILRLTLLGGQKKFSANIYIASIQEINCLIIYFVECFLGHEKKKCHIGKVIHNCVLITFKKNDFIQCAYQLDKVD